MNRLNEVCDYLTLFDRLKLHHESNIYPFHMPGHKRNSYKAPAFDSYSYDITEIDGFDDLHHPQGCIKEAEDRASGMYGTLRTYFLINGCTAGILTAISAVFACNNNRNRKGILMARNCHKAVYNAVMLNRLRPYYLWPEYYSDSNSDIANNYINPLKIRNELLKHNDIGCIIITSPTYEGYTADVSEIAAVAHEYDIPLIVDEAHGAHFQWGDMFPDSAINLGADIVIHGIHKTLPSFTQTALLHVCSERIALTEIRRYLSVYQSSSPSYLLMGSIDYCLEYIRNDGIRDYKLYMGRLRSIYDRLQKLKSMYVLPYGTGRDASKLVVCTDRMTIDGRDCYNILRENYNIQPEMSSREYVILMTSVWDTEEAYDRLVAALTEIDAEYGSDNAGAADTEYRVDNNNNADIHKSENVPGDSVQACNKIFDYNLNYKNEYVMNLYEAVHSDSESVSLYTAAGRISCDMVYLYPPGIPYIVPGERISDACINMLNGYVARGYEIKGMADESGDMVRVVRQLY